MKVFFATIIFLCFGLTTTAQKLNPSELRQFRLHEDSLKKKAFQIVFSEELRSRFNADSIFTRQFVKALRETNSFYYPFDSLQNISRLYAPDSSFRIFTWQLVLNVNAVRQHGALQLRTQDGSLKLFPLIDKSDVTENIEDTIADNNGWIGAVYYRIIQKENAGKRYYLLLGFDENDIRSNRKYIDVLTFPDGKPLFGAKIFNVPNDQLKAKSPARYVMEYKKDASPRLTYDSDLHLFVMEHLVSEEGDNNKKYTLVGDGDYEGLKWMNGRLIYVNKIFNEITPEGQAPVPAPVSKPDVVRPVIDEE